MSLQTATAATAASQPYPFQVRRISDVAGAEITGVDLSQPIGRQMADAIIRAMEEFHVIAFRDQDLTKDQQYEFTLNFGEIESHVGRKADGTQYPIVHTVTNLDEKTESLLKHRTPMATISGTPTKAIMPFHRC